MREAVYIIVIINVIIGFVLLYRKPRPFKGKTYKDMCGNNQNSRDKKVKSLENEEGF